MDTASSFSLPILRQEDQNVLDKLGRPVSGLPNGGSHGCRVGTAAKDQCPFRRLTDGQGRQVSFKNTIIIMTSNVGSKAIADLSGKDEEEMRHQVDAAMAQTFRPEFLNRIDDIVVFHPLGMAQIEKIVDIQLADVRARLAKERMTLAITPAAKQMLAVGGLDPVFGARPLKRLVQREVVDAIAAAIIDGTVREGDQVTVDVDKDGGFTVVCDNTPAATYEVPDAE